MSTEDAKDWHYAVNLTGGSERHAKAVDHDWRRPTKTLRLYDARGELVAEYAGVSSWSRLPVEQE